MTADTDVEALKSALRAQAAHLNTLLPGKQAPSETMVRAIFAYSGEIVELARDVASRSGVARGAKEGAPAPDFSLKTYEQFQADLAEAEASPAPALDRTARGPGQSLLVEVLKIVLAGAGVSSTLVDVVMTVLVELAKQDTQDLIRHIKNRHWGSAKTSLTKILNVLRSSRFRTRLAKRIGAKASAQLVGRIASKFIPFIGPAAFIATIIWEIAKRAF